MGGTIYVHSVVAVSVALFTPMTKLTRGGCVPLPYACGMRQVKGVEREVMQHGVRFHRYPQSKQLAKEGRVHKIPD